MQWNDYGDQCMPHVIQFHDYPPICITISMMPFIHHYNLIHQLDAHHLRHQARMTERRTNPPIPDTTITSTDAQQKKTIANNATSTLIVDRKQNGYDACHHGWRRQVVQIVHAGWATLLI